MNNAVTRHLGSFPTVVMVTYRKMAVSLAKKAVAIPSIFDGDSEEEADSDEEYLRNAREETGPTLVPLQEAVSEVPRTFQEFLDILLPRIRPSPDVARVSLEDQQSLVNVVSGEIANQFSTLQLQATDPFLSAAGNKELHRRIIVKVIGIIEDVYSQYIAKACDLHKDALFSVSSGMSRLRAQLSVDLNKSINLVVIRRRILEEMNHKNKIVKTIRIVALSEETVKAGPSFEGPPSFNIRSAQIKKRVKKLESAAVQEMGPVPSPRPPAGTRSRGAPTFNEFTGGGAEGGGTSPLSTLPPGQPLEDRSEVGARHSSRHMQRSSSLPDMGKNSLLKEMRPKFVRQKKYLTLSKEEWWEVKKYKSVESLVGISMYRVTGKDAFNDLVLGECTQEQLSDDLKRLTTRATSTLNNDDIPHDLPPLLLAQGHGLSDKKAKKLQDWISSKAPPLSQLSSPHPFHPLSSTLQSSSLAVPQIEEVPPTRPISIFTDNTTAPSLHDHSLYSCFPDHPDELAGGLSGNSLNPSGTFLPGLGLYSAGGGGLSGVTQGSQRLSLSLDYQSSSRDNLERSSIADSLPSDRDRHPLAESHPVTVLQAMGGSSSSCSSGVALSGAERPAVEPGSHPLPTGGGDGVAAALTVVDPAPEPTAAASTTVEGRVLPEPQPDVVRVVLPNKENAMVSDISVSERKPWSSLSLRPSGPVCDGLGAGLDPKEVVQLDHAIYQSSELHSVYEAINTTLRHDYMQFDCDPSVLPCMVKKVSMEEVLASSSLLHRHSRRIVNPSLHQSVVTPWGEGDRKEWLSSQYHGGSLKNPPTAAVAEGQGALGSVRKARANKILWQSTINTDDFHRFVMSKPSDYLGLVYHLYNSDSDSEEEEIQQVKRREEEARLKRFREKKKKLISLQREKEEYCAGLWNTKTITMGGLGQPPPDPSQEANSTEAEFADLTTLDSSLQTRLEAVWVRLHYPQPARMDMAVKYTSERYRFKLDHILECWETACGQIECREEILTRLERFEETASRPNRFFKGPQASAAHRLQEARERAKLLQEIGKAAKAVTQTLSTLKKKYSDVLLFKGLSYAEKMKKDLTEMLYCIQQDRRADQLG